MTSWKRSQRFAAAAGATARVALEARNLLVLVQARPASATAIAIAAGGDVRGRGSPAANLEAGVGDDDREAPPEELVEPRREH